MTLLATDSYFDVGQADISDVSSGYEVGETYAISFTVEDVKFTVFSEKPNGYLPPAHRGSNEFGCVVDGHGNSWLMEDADADFDEQIQQVVAGDEFDEDNEQHQKAFAAAEIFVTAYARGLIMAHHAVLVEQERVEAMR